MSMLLLWKTLGIIDEANCGQRGDNRNDRTATGCAHFVSAMNVCDFCLARLVG